MAVTAFGRYVLLEKLAMGGMAELFLAQVRGEGGFSKTCVVKRVLPHLAGDREFIQMFLDEARLAARLEHPGIVQLFDLGKEGEDYYYAMEYLPGEDLAQVLKALQSQQRLLPVEVAARLIRDAAHALHFAHEQRDEQGTPLGIVHRDVSPSNLLLTYRGQLKVLDFGIAKAEARLGQTMPGTVKGKAAYMSPEQSLGRAVDRRADVWALGVCLHELLTGKRLFSGESLAQTAMSVCQGTIPRVKALRADVPEALDEIVFRALQRELSARFVSAEALAGELDRFLDALPAVDLGRLLTELFGKERAEEKLGKTSAGRGVSRAASPPTEALAPAEPKTVTTQVDRAPERSASRPARALIAVAGLLVLAGGAMVWNGSTASGPAALNAGASPTAGSKGTESGVNGAKSPTAGAADSSGAGPGGNGEAAAVEDSRSGSAADVSAASSLTSAAEPTSDDGASRIAATTLPTTEPSAKETTRRAKTLATGFLSLESNAPVTVLLNGKRLGTTPLTRAKLPAGSHLLKLTNPSLGLSRTVRVRVDRNELTSHRVTFGKGELNVSVHPWADVWLNGKKIGQTPLAARSVWEGLHRVRLVGPSGEKTVSVAVAPGQSVAVREQLP